MFKDIKIINNTNFKDKRGLLWTTWKKGLFRNIKFNHDKFSLSKKNTLRGLHCDFKSWKMITSVYGKLLFVIVDMRKKSKNYLKYKKWTIDHKKPKIILTIKTKYCSNLFLIFKIRPKKIKVKNIVGKNHIGIPQFI